MFQTQKKQILVLHLPAKVQHLPVQHYHSTAIVSKKKSVSKPQYFVFFLVVVSIEERQHFIKEKQELRKYLDQSGATLLARPTQLMMHAMKSRISGII